MNRTRISIELVKGINTKTKTEKRPLLKAEVLRAECARAEPLTLKKKLVTHRFEKFWLYVRTRTIDH